MVSGDGDAADGEESEEEVVEGVDVDVGDDVLAAVPEYAVLNGAGDED